MNWNIPFFCSVSWSVFLMICLIGRLVILIILLQHFFLLTILLMESTWESPLYCSTCIILHRYLVASPATAGLCVSFPSLLSQGFRSNLSDAYFYNLGRKLLLCYIQVVFIFRMLNQCCHFFLNPDWSRNVSSEQQQIVSRLSSKSFSNVLLTRP